MEEEELQKLLRRVCPAIDKDDDFTWTLHKSGQFIVKSFTQELAKNTNFNSHVAVKGIWRGLVPHRIEIFLWTALLGKINTKSKLASLTWYNLD